MHRPLLVLQVREVREVWEVREVREGSRPSGAQLMMTVALIG